MQLKSNRTIAGLILAIGALQFFTFMMIGEALAPGYSVKNDPISALGTIAESSALFNVSVFALGVLNAFAGYLLYRDHGRKWILALFVLAGIGAMGVGVFTLNTPGIHAIFALIAFLFTPLEAIACTKLTTTPLRQLLVALGVWALVGLALHFLEINGPLGEGGMERLFVYPSILFLLIFGGYLMSPAPRASARGEWS